MWTRWAPGTGMVKEDNLEVQARKEAVSLCSTRPRDTSTIPGAQAAKNLYSKTAMGLCYQKHKAGLALSTVPCFYHVMKQYKAQCLRQLVGKC